MAAQNIYDDPEILAGYVTLERQVRGLDGAAEWPELSSMLPVVDGQRVVDLGCGFGWFSRWAEQQGAEQVLGVDVSTKMLDRAHTETESEAVQYRCVDLDQLDLLPNSADLVFSSLTLHYINAVIAAGFSLDRVVEWGPSGGDVDAQPELEDDRHRPWFLLLRATLPMAEL